MNQDKKNKGIRGVLIALIVVLAVVLIVLLAATIFVNSILGGIAREDTVETLSQEELDAMLNETDPEPYTGETVAAEDIVLPENAVGVIDSGENIINILLVGQDNKSIHSRSRTDAMILCTINKEAGTLTMTSFLRDLYVTIPGYYSQRLNVAYPLGGFETLYDALEYNFGAVVDKGIGVNFSSFPEVIDAVGGVEIELTQNEAYHLNNQNYTWGLTAGVNLLNGDQALAYSRIRKLDSDFGRTERQRKVITSLLEEAKDLPLTELYGLVQALIPMVVTDMTNEEIISTAMELAPLLSDLEIITQRVPVDGEYYMTMISGMSVIVANSEATKEYLQDTIGETAP